ncbi:MAG: cell division protein FtsZ [Chlorobiaceae bacterium]|nr:cell division protein FtsZ [Chlorobiaceae bacterium]NTV15899.1 cell division protein FtsZ [Chlorobiaceae bacterium]
MTFELDPGLFENVQGKGITIKIVGIGGCGCNVLNTMIENEINGVQYVAFNTAPQELLASKAPIRVRIGKNAANGIEPTAVFAKTPLNNPLFSEEDREHVATQLHGADIVIIAAGMGKSTGSTAAPLIALIARNMGILTLGLVTKPFTCEGKMKAKTAEDGITELRKYIDTLILVDNEQIMSGAEEHTTVNEAFNMANDVIYRAAKGIADILNSRGHINVNFGDLCGLMTNAGEAVIGTAAASGERRALRASTDAFNNLLLGGVLVQGAKGLLVNITGEVTMKDLAEAMTYIEDQVGNETTIINGYIDEATISGETRVTVIITGFKRKPTEDLDHTRSEKHKETCSIGNGTPSLPKTDYSIPAYIRRRTLIHDGEPEEQSPLFPVKKELSADRIQKGLPDTPAYLRRIKNGNND